MTADTPTPLVPKLRFPEFDVAPEWEEHSLGEVCEMKAGDFVRASDIFDVQKDGFFPCYGGNGLRGFVKTYTHDGLYVLVGRQGALCGNVNLFDGFFHATEHALVATPSSGIDTHWLYYALEIRKLNRFATGQAQPGLSVTILNAVPIAVPADRDEQKRIADCLGSLDDLIAAERRKLEALRQHKQGLMQQLFPQPGETVPRLRFPEFVDAPEWDLRKLGPLTTKIGSGITPLGGESNYKTHGRPFIRSQNVGWGELILDNVAYIDEEMHSSFDATELVVSDVLLNITGASIGRSAVADVRIVGGNVNQHVCIIRVNENELSPGLLNQYLISGHGQNQIDSFQAGGNRQGLNFGQIRSFEIPLPSTFAEQQRIADCLSALDARLAAQVQKLVALKAHKRGLLQQLFPSLEDNEQ
ncbi:MAG: restriction endonuclease subunit S [Candidatus Kapaibacterium sp.]